MRACVGLPERPQGAGAHANEGAAAAGHSAPDSLLINSPHTFPKRIRGPRQQAVEWFAHHRAEQTGSMRRPIVPAAIQSGADRSLGASNPLSVHSAVKPPLLSPPFHPIPRSPLYPSCSHHGLPF